ncbi:glycosyltransferase, partial [Candidatus Gottesmanbacteria bacterium]|nr:glycosyltransferase [Candidatus Gottesmanbacteria bacterium]
MDRLLVLSDDPSLATGLGRCVRELTKRFVGKYELAVAGWHHTPIRHQFPFHIYPLIKGDPEEGQQLYAVLKDFSPQHLLCIGDIWDFGYLAAPLSQYRSEGKVTTHLWVTPDGEWTTPRWEEVIRLFDHVASFSHFGSCEVKKIASVDCPVIYPGVDRQVFFRPEKFTHEENVKGELGQQFVIVTVAQNTTRKQLPFTLETYAKFRQGRPDTHLVMLTDPNDPNGHNLINIARFFGLLDGPNRALSFVRQDPRNAIPDQKVAFTMLLGHCFMSTSVGDGYNLPLLEAMSCGVVPIGTKYSAIPEVIGDRGFLIEPASYFFGAYDVRRGIASTEDGVSHLTTLYDDWKSGGQLINALSSKCIDFAKEQTWDKTVHAILEMIQRPIEQAVFVRVDKPRRDEVCMVIPSWGKACGIAEYTQQLVSAMERDGQKVRIFPSPDLPQLLKLREQQPFGIVHIQHEFSFFPDHFLLQKSLEILRQAGLKTVVTLHSAVKLPAYNRILLQTVDRVILHA